MGGRKDRVQSIAPLPPDFDTELVAEAMAEQFGLRGKYTPLVSERDQNFCLTTADGGRYVVKVTSVAEASATTDFQIAALRHLENCGVRGVPRIVQTASGKDRGTIIAADGSSLCLRALSWVSGTLLGEIDISPKAASQLGCRLAELDTALESFVDAGDGQASRWDTQRAGQLRSLLAHVDDLQVRQYVEAVLDEFDKHVLPLLDALPCQVIHNDGHGENILLDTNGDVFGIIDFGDLLRAPRIIEVSTAAAYLRPDDGDPLQLIVPFVAGYHRVSPLSASEYDLLFDLVRTRLAMTIILYYWRLAARGKDDPYLQKQCDSEAGAFTFLQEMSRPGRAAFRDRISP